MHAAGSLRGDVLVHGLGAASQDDLSGYLDWRLGRFEMQSFMTPVALQMIARLSGGRYAAADVLCQMSLLQLRRLTLDRADARVVRQAVATLVARQSAKLEADKPRAGVRTARRTAAGLRRRQPRRQGDRTRHVGTAHAHRPQRAQRRLSPEPVLEPPPCGHRRHARRLLPRGSEQRQRRLVERAKDRARDPLRRGRPRHGAVQAQGPGARVGWRKAAPFAEEESLADTAVMPQQAEENPAIWRIK